MKNKKNKVIFCVVVVSVLFVQVFSSMAAGIEPVYRFWSSSFRSHFFTSSESEKNKVIATWPDVWDYEGTGFYTLSGPASIDTDDIKDGTISNADISSSANISASKLNLDNNIDTDNIKDGTISNIDISLGASVDSDKINYSGKTIDLENSGFLKFGNDRSISRNINGDLGFLNSGGDFSFLGGAFKYASTKPFYFNYINDTSYGAAFQNTGGVFQISGPPLSDNGNITVKIDSFLKLKPVDSAGDCDSTTEGTVYYNSTDHKLKVCNGTIWSDLN